MIHHSTLAPQLDSLRRLGPFSGDGIVRWPRLTLLLLAGAGLPGLAAAQAPLQFLVSTSSDLGSLSTALPFLEDQHALLVGPGLQPRPFLTDAHWRAMSALLPGDIDGLALDRSQTHAFQALRFSLLSDEAGFLDGDILGLKPGGGFEVVLSELTLTADLGVSGSSIDVDGFDFDTVGGLYFTLQNDLPGTVLGNVLDGDVLYRSPSGVITRPFSEAQVQQAVATIAGGSVTVGDVQGIAYDPAGICVAVQSPSAYDGAVVLLGATPSLIASESDMSLGGGELDGLTIWPQSMPQCGVWYEEQGSPGAGRAVLYGAPFEVLTLIPAALPGYEAAQYFPGFGAWCLTPNDVLINQAVVQGLPVFALDGQGRYEFAVNLQPALAGLGFGGKSGYTFQPLSLSTAELGAPVRVEF
jgi:hypothetical protein